MRAEICAAVNRIKEAGVAKTVVGARHPSISAAIVTSAVLSTNSDLRTTSSSCDRKINTSTT